MTSHCTVRLAILSIALLGAYATAEEYDYEVGIAFATLEADTTTVTAFGTISGSSTSVSSSDADLFDVDGRWYYSGLSDDEGPKVRAAFIDRASSLSLSYAQSDQTSSVVVSVDSLPDFRTQTSTDTRAFAANLRHVWQESGWYALATLGQATLDRDFQSQNFQASSDIDTNVIGLGVGKYLADLTTLDLRLLSQDTDSSRASGISIGLQHLASIGDTWMFGADASLTKTDTSGDGDAWNLRLSLYPNSNVDFGVAYSNRDIGGGLDAESFDLFVGWFFNDSTSVRASYTEDTSDTGLGSDADSNGFEIGFLARF